MYTIETTAAFQGAGLGADGTNPADGMMLTSIDKVHGSSLQVLIDRAVRQNGYPMLVPMVRQNPSELQLTIPAKSLIGMKYAWAGGALVLGSVLGFMIGRRKH